MAVVVLLLFQLPVSITEYIKGAKCLQRAVSELYSGDMAKVEQHLALALRKFLFQSDTLLFRELTTCSSH